MRGCDLGTYDLIVISQLIEKEIESLEGTIKLAGEYLKEATVTKSTIEDSLGIVVARKENLEEMLFKIGYEREED